MDITRNLDLADFVAAVRNAEDPAAAELAAQRLLGPLFETAIDNSVLPTRRIGHTPALFRRDALLQCRSNQIGRDLPEIVRLLNEAAFYAANEQLADLVLQSLNLSRVTTRNPDGSPRIVLHDPTDLPHVLQPLTIAEYFVTSFKAQVYKLSIDEHGTHAIDRNGKRLATFANASIEARFFVPAITEPPAYHQDRLSTVELLTQITGLSAANFLGWLEQGRTEVSVARRTFGFPSKDNPWANAIIR